MLGKASPKKGRITHTSMPTLPPRKKTLPGRVSPRPVETSDFNLTNPSRPPPKTSTAWISMLRKTYGSLWNSWAGFRCRSKDCRNVESQMLNAGKRRRSSLVRSGTLRTEIGAGPPPSVLMVKLDMGRRRDRMVEKTGAKDGNNLRVTMN